MNRLYVRWNGAVADWERDRLDRDCRRPADVPAAIALAYQLFGEKPNRVTGTVAPPFRPRTTRIDANLFSCFAAIRG